jgi:hypothetical protein
MGRKIRKAGQTKLCNLILKNNFHLIGHKLAFNAFLKHIFDLFCNLYSSFTLQDDPIPGILETCQTHYSKPA